MKPKTINFWPTKPNTSNRDNRYKLVGVPKLTCRLLPLALNRMRRPYVLGRVKKINFIHRGCKIVSEDFDSSKTKRLFLFLRHFPLFRADFNYSLTWYEKGINRVLFLCWMKYVNKTLFLYLTFKAKFAGKNLQVLALSWEIAKWVCPLYRLSL